MGDSLALYCLPQFHGILARPSRVNVERACSRASLGLGTPPSQIHSFYASRKVSLPSDDATGVLPTFGLVFDSVPTTLVCH